MGIESTRYIDRQDTIDRITYIINLIEEADWVELYNIAEDEDGNFKEDFVNNYKKIHKDYIYNNDIFKSLDNWPNKYLEDFMDKMGVRYSIFENYLIGNDADIHTEPQGINKYSGLNNPQGNN